jgi:hypothetical protein
MHFCTTASTFYVPARQCHDRTPCQKRQKNIPEEDRIDKTNCYAKKQKTLEIPLRNRCSEEKKCCTVEQK